MEAFTMTCCPPTVTALPKRQLGDFINNAMMVLLSDGTIVGWGDNTTGVLANGNAVATNEPAQKVLFDPNTTMPPSGATIVDWALTNANLYVIFSNGWAYSAGQNDYGQLGHGDLIARPWLNRIEYFVTNSLSVTKVWAAGAHTTTNGGGCVYFQASDYSMYACGENTAGNLGNAATPTSNVTTPAPCAGIGHTTNHVIDVQVAAVGTSFSAYMLFNDGTLFVAGYNTQGQLGTGTTTGVTGTFVTAKKTGSVAVSTAKSISANAGSTAEGNALFVDTAGNVWTTGYNGHGELALGTITNVNLFTEVSGLSGIVTAELGCGAYGVGYALTSVGAMYTWGYNGQNNLFQNNSTTPVKSPVSAGYVPGAVAKVFLPKANSLSTDAQLIVLTTSGVLVFAGVNNGQEAIDNNLYSGAYSYIPTPRQLLDGTETISDLFVHGNIATQRWFILTTLGNLYACGSNVDSICTGGVSSDTMAANVEWYRIAFPY